MRARLGLGLGFASAYHWGGLTSEVRAPSAGGAARRRDAAAVRRRGGAVVALVVAVVAVVAVTVAARWWWRWWAVVAVVAPVLDVESWLGRLGGGEVLLGLRVGPSGRGGKDGGSDLAHRPRETGHLVIPEAKQVARGRVGRVQLDGALKVLLVRVRVRVGVRVRVRVRVRSGLGLGLGLGLGFAHLDDKGLVYGCLGPLEARGEAHQDGVPG